MKKYDLESKDFTHPPHDPVSLAALKAVMGSPDGAKYVDIGRAVSKARGRRSTSRRSNVAQGVKVMDTLAMLGLVECFFERGTGSDRHLQYRWRLKMAPSGIGGSIDLKPVTK
jgi:hypothetical protein